MEPRVYRWGSRKWRPVASHTRWDGGTQQKTSRPQGFVVPPPPGPVSVAAAPREGDLSQEQHLCVRGRRQRPQGEFGGPSAVGTWGKHLLDEPRCHRRVEASLRTSPPWGKAREVMLSLALGLGLVPCKRPCGASLGDLVSVLSLKTLLLTGWLSFGQFWRPE